VSEAEAASFQWREIANLRSLGELVMKRLFPPFLIGPAAGGMLLLRVVAGAAFIMHGWSKTMQDGKFTMFSWMGEQAGMPGFMQALAVAAELLGGAAWILGLLTPVASVGIIIVMLTAITTVHLPAGDPFVSMKGHSYELALVYFAIGAVLLVVGPGIISVDGILFGRQERPMPTGEPQTPVEEPQAVVIPPPE
jgi:putative oxidoreductase